VGSNLAKYTAELGGKVSDLSPFPLYNLILICRTQTPIIIFDDADIEAAVNGTAFACFVASGQTCVSGARIIVQDQIYDRFMDGLCKKVRSITKRIGNRACGLHASLVNKYSLF